MVFAPPDDAGFGAGVGTGVGDGASLATATYSRIGLGLSVGVGVTLPGTGELGTIVGVSFLINLEIVSGKSLVCCQWLLTLVEVIESKVIMATGITNSIGAKPLRCTI